MITIDRPTIRKEARETLKGKWSQPVLASLITLIVCVVIETTYHPSVGAPAFIGICGGLIGFFFYLNLVYGYSISLLRFCRGRENAVGQMFSAGFSENYLRALGTVLLTYLFILLWSLLFLFPGLVKAYSYSMTFFIAEDHPEMTPNQCIERSIAMMTGHKMDLFLLHLSFIGWILLGILTLGIGFLWIMPYINTAQAKFYEKLKTEIGEA